MNQRLLVAAGAVAAALLVTLLVRSNQGNRTRENASDSLVTQAPAEVTPPVASVDTTPATVSPLPGTGVTPATPRDTAERGRPGGPPAPPAPAQAQSGPAASALKQAAAAYAGVRSMRADFVQRTDNPLLGRQTTSRGTVMQRQPDRFLMRFTEPAGDVIVSDGQYFWVYYPSADPKQVIRSRAGNAGGLDLQAQFIGDPTTRFRFTDLGREEVSGRAARVVTLVPREPAGYRSLKVWIDERDHLVRRFELTNDNGVVQQFELSNLQINPALANDVFRFTPPSGARIIDR
jgi:outer membrane lipoprotein carrier protein